MILKNHTHKTILAHDLKEAKTLKEKSVGLLSAAKPYALLFHTRWGIHTFGMKYPIDVLVLNKHNYVVKLKEKLKPNQIFLWNPMYHCIIELPTQTIHHSKTSQGDLVKWK